MPAPQLRRRGFLAAVAALAAGAPHRFARSLAGAIDSGALPSRGDEAVGRTVITFSSPARAYLWGAALVLGAFWHPGSPSPRLPGP